jgi:transcriptional regulator with XRE-family HTH domain
MGVASRKTPVDRELNVKLGKCFLKARRQAGLTQSDVAEKVGVTHSVIYHWETGRSMPILQTLLRIADAYGVSLDELVGREFKP